MSIRGIAAGPHPASRTASDRSLKGARRGGEFPSPTSPCSVAGRPTWGGSHRRRGAQARQPGSGGVVWCTVGLVPGSAPVVGFSLPSRLPGWRCGVLSGPAMGGLLWRHHRRGAPPPWAGQTGCRLLPSVVIRSPNVTVSVQKDLRWSDQPEGNGPEPGAARRAGQPRRSGRHPQLLEPVIFSEPSRAPEDGCCQSHHGVGSDQDGPLAGSLSQMVWCSGVAVSPNCDHAGRPCRVHCCQAVCTPSQSGWGPPKAT